VIERPVRSDRTAARSVELLGGVCKERSENRFWKVLVRFAVSEGSICSENKRSLGFLFLEGSESMEEGSESMVRYVEEGIIVCVFVFVSYVYTSCFYLIFYFNFNLIKKI
jgi:hypothetical protein